MPTLTKPWRSSIAWNRATERVPTLADAEPPQRTKHGGEAPSSRLLLRDASRSVENPAGDDKIFLVLLRTLVERYQGKEITNADFEQAIEEVLPHSLWFENRKSLDWFFDGWVNGTAFPQLELAGVKFSRSAGTVTVSGTIRQNSAPPDLVTSVPVYGVGGNRNVYLGRVFAEGDETHFSLPTPADVKQVVLDPHQTVLTAP